jgi:hypothetical protein
MTERVESMPENPQLKQGLTVTLRTEVDPAEPIIRQDSILLQLPRGLHRTQLLYFDAMRHAAEIADIAYRRLQKTLTHIALVGDHGVNSDWHAHAFLDAWAFVDAVERIRGLLTNAPNAQRIEPNVPQSRTFDELINDNKKVRDIADHLVNRMQKIQSKNGPASGTLTWFTVEEDQNGVLMCALIPGTSFHKSIELHHNYEEFVEPPTGCIRLQIAHEFSSLSDMHSSLRGVMRSIESSLSENDALRAVPDNQKGGDVVVRTRFKVTRVSK